jgi:hypothetical protein
MRGNPARLLAEHGRNVFVRASSFRKHIGNRMPHAVNGKPWID